MLTSDDGAVFSDSTGRQHRRAAGWSGSTVERRDSVVIRRGCASSFCPGEMAGIKGKADALSTSHFLLNHHTKSTSARPRQLENNPEVYAFAASS